MSTYSCPKGHDSTESDFCSVCGTRIESNQTSIATVTNPTNTLSAHSGSIACPDCGTIHDPADGKFCEICGHNFATGQSGELPLDLPPVEIPPVYIPSIAGLTQPETPPLPVTPPIAPLYTLTITIDPSLAAPESPPAPTLAPITIPLGPSMTPLIGRNKSKTVPPEIALDFDNAVSTRHALIACQTDGTVIIRDLGSSNGTQLNGQELEPMRDYPFNTGDRLTLGHWTSITLS